MDKLKIERLGGVAGFGTGMARLASRGETALSALSTADRASVEQLFKGPKAALRGGPVRDGFLYRLTRESDGGKQTIEVPEALVPEAIKGCVKDTLL